MRMRWRARVGRLAAAGESDRADPNVQWAYVGPGVPAGLQPRGLRLRRRLWRYEYVQDNVHTHGSVRSIEDEAEFRRVVGLRVAGRPAYGHDAGAEPGR